MNSYGRSCDLLLGLGIFDVLTCGLRGKCVFFCSFFNVIIPKNFENLCVFLGFLLRPMCTCPKNPISFMHWIPFFSFCLISQLTFSQSQVPNPVNYLSVSLSLLTFLSLVSLLCVFCLFILYL